MNNKLQILSILFKEIVEFGHHSFRIGEQLLVVCRKRGGKAVGGYANGHRRTAQRIVHRGSVLRLADDDTNGRVLVRQTDSIVQHVEVELHLAFVFRLEFSNL